MENIFSDYKSSDCKDTVIFDVLNFIRTCGNSEEAIETWYSDLEYPETTELYSLFDINQDAKVYLLGNTLHFYILENNKVLLISEEQPNDKNHMRAFFGMGMYSNADKCYFSFKNDGNGSVTCRLSNDLELNNPLSKNVMKTSFEVLSDKIYLKDLVDPVTFDQLYERGIIGNKKTGTR